MLTSSETKKVVLNLFPGAHWVVHETPKFPWHRDRSKAVTASLAHSSQALALDLFATIERSQSRNAIVDYWVESLGLPLKGPWTITPEFQVPASLLGEPRSTQVDAIATGAGGLVLFECKFTEPGGGSCSQTRSIAKGRHSGLHQCNGNYEEQHNPASPGSASARCVLSAKGVKYWNLIPDVLNIAAQEDHRPCPFAGSWYQWMRNLVSALALARQKDIPTAVVVVYADGSFPMAKHVDEKDWKEFASIVTGTVPLRTVSYQTLLAWAKAAALPADLRLVEDLEAWMLNKISSVERRAAAPSLDG